MLNELSEKSRKLFHQLTQSCLDDSVILVCYIIAKHPTEMRTSVSHSISIPPEYIQFSESIKMNICDYVDDIVTGRIQPNMEPTEPNQQDPK